MTNLTPCTFCGFSENDVCSVSGEDLRGQLQKLDTDVSRVEALLEQLVLKRVLLNRQINQRTSPLLRIPPELTSEIFKLCLGEDAEAESEESELWSEGGEGGDGSAQATQMTPYFIGSICSAWRDLAWSMQWLWSSVNLDLDGCSPTCAELLDEWFSRSGDRLLNISLQCSSFDDWDTVSRVLRTVSGCSERWWNIDFNLVTSCFDALRPVRGCIPFLTSMSLCALWPRYEPDEPYDMFSVAPRLRTVHHENFPPGFLILPPAQLTSLSTNSFDVDCLEVLGANPQMVHYGFVGLHINTEPNESHVFAPHLQSLNFHSYTNIADTLLDRLTTPGLCEMSLTASSRGTGVSFAHSNFVSFISRSACSIQMLSIHHFHLTDDHLLNCMHALPSLRDFTLRGVSGITSQIIHVLNPSHESHFIASSSTPLLPNLQKLSIHSYSLHISFTTLHSMLCSRFNSEHEVARLQSVTIWGSTAEEDTHAPGVMLLQQLVAEGMKISVRSGTGENL